MAQKSKICVISDSHGSDMYVRTLTLDTIYTHILFLGDGIRDFSDIYDDRITLVEGNCDYFSDSPLEDFVFASGKKIMLTHGHLYNVIYGLARLISEGVKNNADIICFGHTHSRFAEYDGNILVLNPGSLASGRYAEIEIDEKGIITYQLKDL